MKIKVTKKHISAAIARNSTHCPVALAFRGAGFDCNVVGPHVFLHETILTDGLIKQLITRTVLLPLKVQKFITAFDGGYSSLKPFEFDIDISSGRITKLCPDDIPTEKHRYILQGAIDAIRGAVTDAQGSTVADTSREHDQQLAPPQERGIMSVPESTTETKEAGEWLDKEPRKDGKPRRWKPFEVRIAQQFISQEDLKRMLAPEFCLFCGAGIGKHRREGEGTCPKCDPEGAARNPQNKA